VFPEALPGLPDGVARASSPPGAFWCARDAVRLHADSARARVGAQLGLLLAARPAPSGAPTAQPPAWWVLGLR